MKSKFIYVCLTTITLSLISPVLFAFGSTTTTTYTCDSSNYCNKYDGTASDDDSIGHYYHQYSATTKKWDDASSFCVGLAKSMGVDATYKSHLVAINSSQEFSFLINKMTKLSNKWASNKAIWIDGRISVSTSATTRAYDILWINNNNGSAALNSSTGEIGSSGVKLPSTALSIIATSKVADALGLYVSDTLKSIYVDDKSHLGVYICEVEKKSS